MAAVVVLVVDEVLEVAGARPKINEVAFKPSTLTISAIITVNKKKKKSVKCHPINKTCE